MWIRSVNGRKVKVDLDRQILKPLCGTGKMFCYDSPEYVKDMGTPERFNGVCADFAHGTVSAKNLKNKQKAIFLDRDGTINKYVGFLRDINDFELLPGVAEAIRKINASGYLAIVVTNQPVIARGEVTFDQLQEIHNKMETLLGQEGAYIDGIYFCPHHPDKGFEGEVPELKIDCDCRKPKPGMLLKAAEDFNIDLSQSWMVGDGENDVKAGLNAGCKTALIGQGKENIGQLVSEISLLGFVKNNLK
jgi:D,D-heptose 1,7-bisphosphate phosphatase